MSEQEIRLEAVRLAFEYGEGLDFAQEVASFILTGDVETEEV